MKMKSECKLLYEECFPVTAGNLEHAGEASVKIKRILKKLGIDSDFIKRVSIACYEAEMNMVIYSCGGSIKLEVYNDKVIVVAEDCGPGIADVELALRDGYSTASDYVLSQGFGAGRGFSNIKRCSDSFSIISEVGKGTKLTLCFNISGT
jgi:serine/threonine-protein kinase RsbT